MFRSTTKVRVRFCFLGRKDVSLKVLRCEELKPTGWDGGVSRGGGGFRAKKDG